MELVKLNDDNYKILRGWRNKYRAFFVDRKTITKEMHDAWFKKYKENKQDYLYLIRVDNKYVGSIGVKLNKDVGLFEITNVLLAHKLYRHQGIMSRALKQLIKKIPDNMIFLEVIADNYRAINFYEKNGFAISQEFEKDGIVMFKMVKNK